LVEKLLTVVFMFSISYILIIPLKRQPTVIMSVDMYVNDVRFLCIKSIILKLMLYSQSIKSSATNSLDIMLTEAQIRTEKNA